MIEWLGEIKMRVIALRVRWLIWKVILRKDIFMTAKRIGATLCACGAEMDGVALYRWADGRLKNVEGEMMQIIEAIDIALSEGLDA